MIGRVLLVAAGVLATQTPPATFLSRVDLVRVDVSVMRGGQPITGLTAANFQLSDNGVPQEIASVTLERVPLSVLLVLDVSSSVAGDRLTHLIDAGQILARSLHSDDRVWLITFSEGVRMAAPLTK